MPCLTSRGCPDSDVVAVCLTHHDADTVSHQGKLCPCL
jgi:hypothetical protein